MKKCDCEHWETCMICYPQGFDAQGKRKPVEAPPSREELQAKVAELTKERDSADAFSKKIADVCEKAEAQIEALEKDVAYRQSVIDQLMLEYCPSEMTKEQLAEWSANQAPSDEDGPSLMDVLMLGDSHENKLATLLHLFDREVLEKEAARYRRLKENKAYNNAYCWHFQYGPRPLILDSANLDKAIDAAIVAYRKESK